MNENNSDFICGNCGNNLFNVGVTKSFQTITYQKFDVSHDGDDGPREEPYLRFHDEHSEPSDDIDVYLHCGECGCDLNDEQDDFFRELEEAVE